MAPDRSDKLAEPSGRRATSPRQHGRRVPATVEFTDSAGVAWRVFEVVRPDSRSGRVRPALDDKRLAAWNALAIHAFA